MRAPAQASPGGWGLLIIGVCATVGANVANGLDHGIIGALVAGWPALVAVGSFELLIRLLRDGRPARHHDPRSITALVHAEPLAEPDGALASPAIPTSPAEPAPPDLEILIAQELYSEDLAQGIVPSIRRLKRDLQIGHPKASRIHSALTQETTAMAESRTQAA